MNIFVVIIVFVVIWAILGSLKAMKEKQPGEETARSIQTFSDQKSSSPSGQGMGSTWGNDASESRLGGKNLMSDDTGSRSGREELQEMSRSKPLQVIETKGKPRRETASASALHLNRKRIAEAIILSECLDKEPRAFRPHPKVQTYRHRS